MKTRRDFLTQSTGALAAAGAVVAQAAPPKKRLIIDTHIEFWTSEPRFPFNHPERPDFKRARMDAPVENYVEQMKDFDVQYAVLINPRYFGWDNSYMSYSYHTYKHLFVAHGLINPEHPKVAEHLRYWVTEQGFQGMRFSPIYHPKSTWLNSKKHYPLWREAEKLGVCFKVGYPFDSGDHNILWLAIGGPRKGLPIAPRFQACDGHGACVILDRPETQPRGPIACIWRPRVHSGCSVLASMDRPNHNA